MTINIIDTPGHADFGGEVERGLSMVDGVVLLVDASEGPLPQTRFVLRKAIAARLPVVLVINKVDRPDARIAAVIDETYELFLDLDDDRRADGVPDRLRLGQGRPGQPDPAGGRRLPDGPDLEPLFDRPGDHPGAVVRPGCPLQAHVTNLDASPFLGRLALCRIGRGQIRKGQQVSLVPAGRRRSTGQDHRAADDRGAGAGAAPSRPGPATSSRSRASRRSPSARRWPTPTTRGRCR